MRKKIIIFVILGSLLISSTTVFTTSAEKISNNIVSEDYNDEEDNSLLTTNNPTTFRIVFEPPWPSYDTYEYKKKELLSDCWSESTTIDGYSGTTNLHAWAGPGAGLAYISKRLIHRMSFFPPKNAEYSFRYKFHQKGVLKLESMQTILGASAARGGVDFFYYLYDGENYLIEKTITPKEHYSIGGVGNGEYPYSITKSYGDSVRLEKGKGYTVGAKGKPWITVDGFVAAAGFADHFAEEAYLDELIIEWPNSPPDMPELVRPSNGAAGVSRSPTLEWTCDDPDGKYETLKYDIYFGTSSSPPLKSSGVSNTFYMPGSLEGETTYYWKVVAKDSTGEETSSQIWKFSTEKESLSKDGNVRIDIPEGFSALKEILINDSIKELFNYLSKNIQN